MKKLKEQLLQLQILSELAGDLLGDDNTEALKPTVRKMSKLISSMDLSVLDQPPKQEPQKQAPPPAADKAPPSPAKPAAPNPQPPKANTNDKPNETEVRPVQPK